MPDFIDIMQKIREILQEQNSTKKIMDKEIAALLNLDPQYFAVIKKRNKIPYESIAFFCKTHHVNMNWLLLGQEPKYLP